MLHHTTHREPDVPVVVVQVRFAFVIDVEVERVVHVLIAKRGRPNAAVVARVVDRTIVRVTCERNEQGLFFRCDLWKPIKELTKIKAIMGLLIFFHIWYTDAHPMNCPDYLLKKSTISSFIPLKNG